MLSDKEYSSLLYFKSLKGRVIQISGWLLAPAFLLMAVKNIYKASETAKIAGIDFSTLIQTWLSGVNLYGSYPGSILSSYQLLGSGLINFIVGITLFIATFFYRKQGHLNMKILEVLEETTLHGDGKE